MVLCPQQEEHMDPESKRWKQEWSHVSSSPVTHWVKSYFLGKQLWDLNIRSPFSRGPRITVNSKLPLALVYFGFLVSQTHQAKTSHCLVTGNRPWSTRGSRTAITQQRKRGTLVNLWWSTWALLATPLTNGDFLENWNNPGSRRKWLSRFETPWEMRFSVIYTGKSPRPAKVIIEGERDLEWTVEDRDNKYHFWSHNQL